MVNICKLRLTGLQQEILRLLYVRAGMVLNARAVSMSLGVSQPAVSKALPQLEKEGWIKVEKDKYSKRLSISLNRDNQLAVWMKRSDNIKQIYDSGLAQHVYDSFPGATVILFGSYAFGEDTIYSDLDMAVIGAKKKDIGMEKFEKILERVINISYFESFRKIDKHLLNSILNGIIIKGAVEL